MRAAFFAATSVTAFALATYACSSSDSSNNTTADAGNSSGSLSSTSSTSGDQSSSSSSSSSSSTSGTSTSSSSSSTGGNTSSGGFPDAGATIDGGDAGTECAAGSTEEVEDNGTTAQVVTAPVIGTPLIVCGRVDPGDTDKFKFTFGSGVGKYTFDYKATISGINISGNVDDTDYVIVGTNPASMPLKTDGPTTITVTAPGITTALDYSFAISVTAN